MAENRATRRKPGQAQRTHKVEDLLSPSQSASLPEPCPASASLQASEQPSGRGLTVSVVFEATERLRLQAIERSAEHLLDRVLGSTDDRAVWNLREVVWPALCLSEFRSVRPQ